MRADGAKPIQRGRPAQFVALQACSKNRIAVTRCGEVSLGAFMRRRKFLALVGGAAAWPLTGHAQQAPMPVIGSLQTGSSGASAHLEAAFQRGLEETGYVEGQNVGIVYRYAD